MWATVLVALITGTTTAGVAISVQLINSQNALNTKKLDILFARKADAYKMVLEKAIEFGVEPKTQEKYWLCKTRSTEPSSSLLKRLLMFWMAIPASAFT
jgi:hypothetical protein